MATDLKTDSEASVTQLLSGRVADARERGRQHLALLQCEVQANLGKARTAGFFLAWGLGTAFVGSILCCLILVHLLAWAAPQLPLWVCYGLIGALVAGLGG